MYKASDGSSFGTKNLLHHVYNTNFMKFPHQFIRVRSGHKFTHLPRVGSDRVSNISTIHRVYI